MAFTPITITGTFERPDASAAAGTLTAILSAKMRNGTEFVETTPVYGILNAAGQLKDSTGERPLIVLANDDSATTPTNPTASYEFTLELDGTPIDPFSAVVSHLAAAGTVDLTALMP